MKKCLAELISVRNLTVLLCASCILISATVCTLLAIDSGDKALDTSRSSAEDNIEGCFSSAEQSILRNVNDLLGSLETIVLQSLDIYLGRPQDLAKTRRQYIESTTPDVLYDYEKFFDKFRAQMWAETWQFRKKIAAQLVSTSKGAFILYVESSDTMANADKTTYYWASSTGEARNWSHYDPLWQDTCAGKGIPCVQKGEVAYLDGSWLPDNQDPSRPGGSPCPCGPVDKDGSILKIQDADTPSKTVRFECNNAHRHEVDMQDELFTSQALQKFPAGLDGEQYVNLDTGPNPATDPTIQHEWINDTGDGRGTSRLQYASGPCPTSMNVKGESWFVLGAYVVKPGQLRWTPILPLGSYLGMMLAGNIVHKAAQEPPWNAYTVGQGTSVTFWYGMDARGISTFLSRIPVGATRTRMYIAEGYDWLFVEGNGMAGPDSTGNLIGSSHGDAFKMVEKTGTYDKTKVVNEPYPIKAPECNDQIVAGTATWIDAQGGYAATRDAQQIAGSAVKYPLTHTLGVPRSGIPAGQSVTEDWYASLQNVKNEFSIDWWVVLTIDHDSMLGAIDERQADTKAEVERVKEETDKKLADDRTLLAVIVAVVAVVLLVFAILFVLRVVSPLLELAHEMNAVAQLRLDEIDETKKSRLAEVRKMQRSFFRMVRNMKEMKSFMPQSLTMETVEEEEEEEPLADGSQRSKSRASRSARTGSKASKHTAASASRASSQHVASTMASSQSAAMKAYLKKMTGEGLKKKKVTIFVVNLVNFHEYKEYKGDVSKLHHVHEHILSQFLAATTESKGVADFFSGDRLMSTYNAVRAVGTHRTAVAHGATTIQKLSSKLADQAAGTTASVSMEGTKVSMGGATGPATCGNMGCIGLKKFSTLGVCVTFAFALERFGRSLKAGGVVIENGVAEDAANGFYIRKLSSLDFPKRSPKPQMASEVMEAKKVGEDEWMYQLEEGAASDPWVAWNSCVMALVAEDWDAATAAMAQVQEKFPGGGGPQLWLADMVEQKQKASTKIVFH